MKYFFILLLLTPLVALAGDPFIGQIVPECPNSICRACDLVTLADNLLRFFVALSVFVASLMFAYAGFLYVTASANKNNFETAKKIFWNVFLGFIFILTAWLIIDISLRVLTGNSLNVMTQIQCVDFEASAGGTGGGYVPSPGTPPSVGNPVGGGGTAGSSNAGLGNVDSNTNYDPGMGGDNGPEVDARGRPIVTAQDYLNCRNAGGTAASCPPITVAAPQDGGIGLTEQFTWPELAGRYGLPADTRFMASDRYGCYRSNPSTRYNGSTPCYYGHTPRGTYSIDVARCSRTNWESSTRCTLGTRSYGNQVPMQTKPTPVGGG